MPPINEKSKFTVNTGGTNIVGTPNQRCTQIKEGKVRSLKTKGKQIFMRDKVINIRAIRSVTPKSLLSCT